MGKLTFLFTRSKTTAIELFGSTLTPSSNGLMAGDAKTVRCTESL